MATSNLAPGLGDGSIYEPKIYGFRVSERAKSGPRMKWLREKPEDINELDEASLYEQQRRGGRAGEIEVEAEADKTPVVATSSRKPGRKIAASKRRGANGGSPMDMDGVGNGG